MNIFAVGNAVVSCDDCSSVVDDPDCIENSLMDECWVDFGFFLLGTDIQCTEASKTTVVDCYSGCMCNASVANLVSGFAVSASSWSIGGSKESSVRPSTILLGSTYVK